jgi:hypothetical protein
MLLLRTSLPFSSRTNRPPTAGVKLDTAAAGRTVTCLAAARGARSAPALDPASAASASALYTSNPSHAKMRFSFANFSISSGSLNLYSTSPPLCVLTDTVPPPPPDDTATITMAPHEVRRRTTAAAFVVAGVAFLQPC